jgi:hypothetical protein
MNSNRLYESRQRLSRENRRGLSRFFVVRGEKWGCPLLRAPVRGVVIAGALAAAIFLAGPQVRGQSENTSRAPAFEYSPSDPDASAEQIQSKAVIDSLRRSLEERVQLKVMLEQQVAELKRVASPNSSAFKKLESQLNSLTLEIDTLKDHIDQEMKRHASKVQANPSVPSTFGGGDKPNPLKSNSAQVDGNYKTPRSGLWSGWDVSEEFQKAMNDRTGENSDFHPNVSGLDSLLAQAMENHPDVVAAKAKLNLAAAELKSKQMEIARQLIGLAEQKKELQQLVLQSEAKLSRLTDINKTAPNSVAKAEIDAAQSELVVARAKFDRNMSDLYHMTVSEARDAVSSGPNTFQSFTHPPATAKRMPQGPAIGPIKSALQETTHLEFAETPLKDVVDYIATKHKIAIQILPDAKDAAEKTPLTMNVRDILLADFFQLFDDGHDDFKFVIRDYGIAVTTPENAEKHGYMPLVDFCRAIAAEKSTDPWRKDTEITKPAASRGGSDNPQPKVFRDASEDDPFGPAPKSGEKQQSKKESTESGSKTPPPASENPFGVVPQSPKAPTDGGSKKESPAEQNPFGIDSPQESRPTVASQTTAE